MKKYIKIPATIVAVFFLLLVLLFAGAKFYIETNKNKLIAKAVKDIEKNYHSIVAIKDLDVAFFQHFPNISLELKNVTVHGPLFQLHGKKLFSAEKIYISISTPGLLTGNIIFGKTEIQKGNLYVYTDSTGVNNLSYFKRKNAGGKQKLELPKNLEFNEFDVTIEDLYKKKLISLFINKLQIKSSTGEDSTTLSIEKDILVKSLSFNTNNGSFLANKVLEGEYDLVFHTKKQELTFEAIQLNINQHPFLFTGLFQLTDSGNFKLDIQTKGLTYQLAKTIVSPNIAKALKLADLNAPLNIHATLDGPLKSGDPLIIARWEVNNTTLITPLVHFKNASFNGLFTNEVTKGLPRKDPNSKIVINNLVADWKGIPVKAGLIEIINLKLPTVNGSFKSEFQLATFNKIINSSDLIFSEGTGSLRVGYNGPLGNINNKNANIDISFLLKKGTIGIKPMDIKLTECKTNISINDADLVIHNMVAKGTRGSSINITGGAKNIFSFLENVPGKSTVQLNIYSPFLNLNSLAPLLSPRKRIAAIKNKKDLNQSIHKIDQLIHNGIISLNIKADKINYDQLKATNFSGDVQLVEGDWNLKKLQFDLAGGSFNMIAGIKNTNNGLHSVFTKVNISTIDSKALFYAFNDFGLNGISYKNLSGNLSATINMKGTINGLGVVNKNSLDGTIQFALKNGSLTNFGPLEKIQETAFKTRNFSDVKFAEIKNDVWVKNGLVNIPRMQIESSVFGLFIEGQYGIAGNTDMRIQVPLRNLANKGPDYVPAKSSNTAKGGMSIFLRAQTGKDGKIAIVLDALGKFRRSNVPTGE